MPPRRPFTFGAIASVRPSAGSRVREEVERLAAAGSDPAPARGQYSAEDDATIRSMHRRGAFASAVAAAIGRTEKSVRDHALQILGLRFPRNPAQSRKGIKRKAEHVEAMRKGMAAAKERRGTNA